jgi:hypothetical protein
MAGMFKWRDCLTATWHPALLEMLLPCLQAP